MVCMYLAQNKVFEYTIYVSILIYCILLASINPLNPKDSTMVIIQEDLDYSFNCIFFLEVVIRTIA